MSFRILVLASSRDSRCCEGRVAWTCFFDEPGSDRFFASRAASICSSTDLLSQPRAMEFDQNFYRFRKTAAILATQDPAEIGIILSVWHNFHFCCVASPTGHNII